MSSLHTVNILAFLLSYLSRLTTARLYFERHIRTPRIITMGSITSIQKNCEEQAQDPKSAPLTRALARVQELYNVAALSFGMIDLFLIARLLRCSLSGTYTVDRQTLIILGGAIIYVAMPCDAIPDFIPFFGYLDDAYVFREAIKMCLSEIQKFQRWEQEAKQR
jgi:Protein of unknown function (DUF1232)